MGYDYKSLEDFKMGFPFLRSCSKLGDFKLFIIGEEKSERLRACEFTQGVLERMFDEAKSSGDIRDYEVKIIDLATSTKATRIDPLYPEEWGRIGNKDGLVFLPIFHNTDGEPCLPQVAFDEHLPAIFSVSQKGYNAVVNRSKRDCYDTVRV